MDNWPKVAIELINALLIAFCLFIIASCVNKGNIFLPKQEVQKEMNKPE